MRRYLPLLAFLIVVLGVNLVISRLAGPDAWYAGLTKPSLNPPRWVFGPVWTLLYVLIAIAGWRIWQRARRSAAMAAWGVQMVLNFLWTPVFFGAHRIGLALAVIVVLLAAILVFIATAWRRDRLAAGLFLPYAAWVGFATALNAAFWILN